MKAIKEDILEHKMLYASILTEDNVIAFCNYCARSKFGDRSSAGLNSKYGAKDQLLYGVNGNPTGKSTFRREAIKYWNDTLKSKHPNVDFVSILDNYLSNFTEFGTRNVRR